MLDLLSLDPSISRPVQFVLFGFCCGLLILLTGIGAGVLLVPGLIALFDVPPTVAVGTASAYAVATKVITGAVHIKKRVVDWPVLFSFVRLAVPAAFVASLAVAGMIRLAPHWASGAQYTLKLLVLIAASLGLISALLPVIQRRMNLADANTANDALTIAESIDPPTDNSPSTGDNTAPSPLTALRLVEKLKALGCGALVGATGVGGGVLVTGVVMGILGRVQLSATNRRTRASAGLAKRVVGTTTIIGLALSAATALVFGLVGQTNLKVLLLMVLGSLLTVPIGTRLFRHMSDAQIWLLSQLLVCVAIAGMLREIVRH